MKHHRSCIDKPLSSVYSPVSHQLPFLRKLPHRSRIYVLFRPNVSSYGQPKNISNQKLGYRGRNYKGLTTVRLFSCIDSENSRWNDASQKLYLNRLFIFSPVCIFVYAFALLSLHKKTALHERHLCGLSPEWHFVRDLKLLFFCKNWSTYIALRRFFASVYSPVFVQVTSPRTSKGIHVTYGLSLACTIWCDCYWLFCANVVPHTS